jgi:peptide/nickel transport system substrate-binding protein
MRPSRRFFRLVVLTATALAVLALAWAGPGRGLGQAAAAAGDLLLAAPFDRVTLIDGTVLNVEPISPRPLPVIDMAKQRELERKKKGKREPPPEEGNIPLPGEKKKPAAAEAGGAAGPLVDVTIHVLEGEVRDYKVKRTNIKSVEFFEDLLLAEADRYGLARDFPRAFECCLKVRARDPKWRGLDDHVNKLLFAEGSAALLDGDGERGLRLLRELIARKADYPGLADRLAESYSARALRAFELGLYARGRKILHDAASLAPGHPALKAVQTRFTTRAKERAEAAKTLDGTARLDALAEALRIWPTLGGTDAAYRAAFAAWPTLDVAVDDVPRVVGPWVRCPADERVTRLLYRPVLARDDEEAQQGKADGQLAAAVTTSDLGRRIVVKLRPGITWSDGSRPVAAVDLARALTDAAEAASLRYSGRWADLLERVDIPEENRVEIRLTRALLKPGAWLLGPVGPAHAGSDGRVAVAGGGRELVGDGPFVWVGSSPASVVLQTPPSASPGDARGPAARIKVRRLREARYPSVATTLGAFRRGEVALVEHVPPDRVAELAALAGVKVGRYARPSLHRIALDGRNPLLRNRSLRRGLSYAIDRRTLLEETILRRPPDAANLVADGVFPKGSYAHSPDVKPLGYDPLLARMLVAAAHKELGRPIELTLEYPAIPEAQAVVPKIAEALRFAGAQVKTVERPASDLEMELRAGRRFDLAYRADRCVEPAAEAGLLLSPAYDAPPSTDPLGSLTSPYVLQLLLQLERAPEWPTARGLVVQIDRECRDELPVLPLWQLEDHYAWHARLKGPGDVADRLYQGVETWEVEPWFARDPW